MSDEIAVGDLTYVSSKRASEISGYAQDYIGQLARKGFIEAKRVGGLWYVHMDSLDSYKTQPDALQTVSREDQEDRSEPDVLVSFDGKDYISANRASKITGYNQDYVGQLARSGKILARQVGNRWYVDRDGLLSHKSEKDALLAAVQVAAVGIKHLVDEPQNESGTDTIVADDELLKYMPDEGELTPTIEKQYRTAEERIYEPAGDDIVNAGHVVDLKNRGYGIPVQIRKSMPVLEENSSSIHLQYSKPLRSAATESSSKMNLVYGSILGGLIIILSIGVVLYINRGDVYRNVSANVSSLVKPLGDGITGALVAVTNNIEQVISPELIYNRSK
jgi:hypothetical protein